MSSRTFYGKVPRALTLGTIVLREEDKKHLLCLQPVCDSVRIKRERRFLFAECSKGKVNQGVATHVVACHEDKASELHYQPKAYKCLVFQFNPSAEGQVIAEEGDDGVHWFKDITGKRYIWIGQLKTAHAQRAVEQFARDLSRVGLTESEWLRKLAGK